MIWITVPYITCSSAVLNISNLQGQNRYLTAVDDIQFEGVGLRLEE